MAARGADGRFRSGDLLRFKQALFHLSYIGTMKEPPRFELGDARAHLHVSSARQKAGLCHSSTHDDVPARNPHLRVAHPIVVGRARIRPRDRGDRYSPAESRT